MEGIVRLSGWLAAIFLALNFLTCWVMPWSREKCPWKGAIPGPDKLDRFGYFMLCQTHKWWVFLTIIFVTIHIVLAVVF